MVHHDIRFLTLTSRTAYPFIFIYREHLIRIPGTHVLLLRSFASSANLKGVKVETSTPVIFYNFEILLVLYVRRNFQHSLLTQRQLQMHLMSAHFSGIAFEGFSGVSTTDFPWSFFEILEMEVRGGDMFPSLQKEGKE